MMHRHLIMIEALLARDRTQAHAADVFEAAFFDQIGGDIEDFGGFLPVFRLEIRNRADEAAPTCNLG